MKTFKYFAVIGVVFLTMGFSACDEPKDTTDWQCVLAEGSDVDFAPQIGCKADFDAVSSQPVSANIPGAKSTKVVIDRMNNNNLYFQNSKKYKIHYEFASTHLSGKGLPVVPMLSQFNETEYYSPDRRFLLGAVTYYVQPKKWVYEISPYDTASADMIETAYKLIVKNTYFGNELFFHPTSDAVLTESAKLPSSVKIITTDQLFADVTYQPLNLGTSIGKLRFLTSAQLEGGDVYVGFRDIVVLDSVPNDISVVNGIITAAFQTPLSHINVLSQNRGTPNMALKGAFNDPTLRSLEGKWIKLTVGAFNPKYVEATQKEADEWWEKNKPDPVGLPKLDLTVTDLRDIEDVLDLKNLSLGDALAKAIPAFGGKASHFASFPHMGDGVIPYPKAFVIPIYYYRQFMEQNKFDVRIDDLLADDKFVNDAATRFKKLKELREDMKVATVDKDFETALIDKLNNDYSGIRMRFRSSTNAEDLDGFTGAGLYTSHSATPGDPLAPVLDAVRKVWASVWFFRAFEERSYRSIDQKAVGMALLVHNSFPDEEANGVAVTGNIFDTQGMEPGYYVNVQKGEVSVVQPDSGITTDQFILHYDMPNQPIVFIGHSSLVQEGVNVLTRAQTLKLGAALKVINTFFNDLYGPLTPTHFYAMDVEFKFDDKDNPGKEPQLFIKQARPYPGWASSTQKK